MNETGEGVATEQGIEAQSTEPAVAPVQAFHSNETTLSEYFESLLVTVLLALFATTFVLQAFKIPSRSMEGTLLVGDHLLVNKFIFGGQGKWYEKFLPYRALERGDIIVFKYPYQDHTHYVKRVIGLPGDRVKLVDQRVFVNGKALDEPYVVHDPAAPYDPLNYAFPPVGSQLYSSQIAPEWARDMRNHIKGDEIVVPAGKYFAMGDNRDQSSDSRYWGFVDRDAIMGRPFVIYWSVEASSADYSASTFAQRLKGIFETLAHLPSRTRWNRMLHTVH
jgi:signal peptidase I